MAYPDSQYENTTPESIYHEIQGLQPSAIIELFQLKLTEEVNGIDITFYYHAGTNELTGNVVFNGKTYAPTPIEIEGFEMSAKGTLPRPTMRIANVAGSISALLLLYNPLQARLKRIRTCKKFLDAANFSSGTNPTADPDARFQDEFYYIDRVSKETPQLVEFELTSKLELSTLALPGRQVVEHCPWVYRGVECGYKGKTYFNAADEKLTKNQAALDVCGKRRSSCKARFGDKPLPHGGFPGSRIQA